MKKLLFLSLTLFFLGLTIPDAQAATQRFNCSEYGGVCLSGTCPTNKPLYNSNGYCASSGCCLAKAGSDQLNAAVQASGNTATPSPAGSGGAPKMNTTPATNDATCTAQGGACSSVATGCPNGSVAKGTCGSSGNCCVPSAPSTPPGGGATAPTAGNNVQINFESPTKYTTVETFLDSVLGFARNIVVILALVFLVIGGLLYITSAGNDKRIGAAKAAVTAALIGLAIVMVAPSFLKELAGVLGWNDLPSQASDALSLTEIATNVLNFLLSIIGIIAIIMFVIGGIMYLTSAGDEKRANTGKDIVKYAIIGIIVALSALVIIKQIAGFF